MSELRIPLRYRDMDDLGHLTHSVYHDFLAEGRVAALAGVLPRDGFPWVLANVTLDYRHEVRRSDREVVVTTTVERVGGRSVTMAQRVALTDGTLCAEGHTTLVAWDPERRASRELTDAERDGLRASTQGG